MEELQNVSSDVSSNARNRIGGRRVNNSATAVLKKLSLVSRDVIGKLLSEVENACWAWSLKVRFIFSSMVDDFRLLLSHDTHYTRGMANALSLSRICQI